ncbi:MULTISPECIES: phosphate ABC transporter permease PstA [Deinococcus]|jgi:phosphate ABC transporter membrane protein 2, PhoT family (TC 3.A.1.7.1)|uniref:Phosphate transport system permease protein PstA n=2 Tax=Deinococcus radiodurans TaxID=1299 RepID=Q9RYZ4_DEIRA|nr:phosphate ABC transporter permease PstA [Deinococcus radiodurans]AAF12205.1 phosphate ABC transporter, permease protein [Deinococcus radiodurans R1 = ATCC 13939 = DSM 20539]ANC73148.1 phosphate ABC transporter, permease protein PstA [Deinococcus radiodurans R1 = ATCC 13939 = DSM 20539]QEM73195.1 phosphate ABC transporter permease PstA [Deinococcus radiodurans]QIP33295.1 phosphate ABC transporter permease PstA [Deinococcus radiodurans]UDL01932.1 phosphate ABC transporter permease PstA [Deino
MTTTAAPPTRPAGLSTGRRLNNLLMGALIVLATAVVVAPLILIFVYLLKEGFTAMFGIQDGKLSTANLNFFTHVPAPEGETGGGMKNAILGSLEMLAMASVIGVGVGVAGGIFLAEYPRHPLMPTIRMLSDVLAGIPAIVMGLVAYGLLVLTMGHFSGLAGALALGFLMIPIVVRTTEEVLKLVPLTVREAGLGLGLPKWLVTLKIVLPAAAGGIITGVMLALARVAGEAAPLLFTAFGNNLVNLDPTKPMSALPLEIYRGATSAYDENQRMAKAGALLLILLIFVTSMLARRFSRRK